MKPRWDLLVPDANLWRYQMAVVRSDEGSACSIKYTAPGSVRDLIVWSYEGCSFFEASNHAIVDRSPCSTATSGRYPNV